MAVFKFIITSAFIATAFPAFADSSDVDYQIQELRAEMEDARQAQAIDAMNAQNHMVEMDAPQPTYQAPYMGADYNGANYGSSYTGSSYTGLSGDSE